MDDILTKLPQDKTGWIVAIVGMVIFAALYAAGWLKAKREKVDEDKHRAGGKAASEARDNAEKVDSAREEIDDFLKKD